MEETQFPEESPPLESEAALIEQRSSWPTAIGVISIIFGACGLVCYGCVSVQSIIGPWAYQHMPEEQRAAMAAPAQGLQLAMQVFQLCASTGLSFWLLFAGIGMARRRPWARAHHVGWSIAKIIVILVSFAVSYAFIPDIVQQINDQLAQTKVNFTLTAQLLIAVSIVQMLFLLVWPIFLLIWCSRASVKAEVEAWGQEERAMI